jgi:flagellar secretion chaperone FliS
MFANPFAQTCRRNPNPGLLYRDVGMETSITDASPHRLVAVLFEAWMDAVTRARGALRSGNVAAKGIAIRHAVRIVEEGLRGNLNVEAGGKLARDLNALYAYLSHRLTLANLRNDDAILAECQRLMKPVQEAWDAIADTPEAQPRALA